MNIRFSFRFKLFASIFLALFFLVIREAILIPLTHDEYSTIMVSYQSIFDILSYKDPIPNNHILNTLLLKLNITTFGDHLFTNRLHNVLSFIPFYIFSVLIAKKLTENLWIQLAIIGALCMQPFLLDFYSVTRGYGLSIAFEVASIYFALLYTDENKTKDLSYSLILAALGVIANFTLLNFYIPLLGIFILIIFFNFRMSNRNHAKIQGLITIAVSLSLAILCITPFKKMVSTSQFSFWSSNNFFNDTIVPLFNSVRVGVPYLKWSGEEFALVLLVFIFILMTCALIITRKNLKSHFIFLFASNLFISVIIYNNLQFYLLKIPFLNARTSLFLIPLVVLVIGSILPIIYEQSRKFGKLMAIVIFLLSVQHFVRGYNGRVNYEWYFNQNTYEFLDEVMFQINSNNLEKPVKLDCHWFYHPSLTYHINDQYKGIIELLPYHKETDSLSIAAFYLSESNESEVLAKYYDKIKDFPGSNGILWKRK